MDFVMARTGLLQNELRRKYEKMRKRSKTTGRMNPNSLRKLLGFIPVNASTECKDQPGFARCGENGASHI